MLFFSGLHFIDWLIITHYHSLLHRPHALLQWAALHRLAHHHSLSLIIAQTTCSSSVGCTSSIGSSSLIITHYCADHMLFFSGLHFIDWLIITHYHSLLRRPHA